MKQKVANGCLIRRHGKEGDEYLFIKQVKDKKLYEGFYIIPGGGVEIGEDLDEAVRREVMEETNVKIKNLKRISFDWDIIENYKNDGPCYMIFLQYTADYESGTPTPGDDAAEIHWIKKEDLSKKHINLPTVKFMKKLGLMD